MAGVAPARRRRGRQLVGCSRLDRLDLDVVRGLAAVRRGLVLAAEALDRRPDRLRVASPAHPPEQRTALLGPARRGRHVYVRGLADPALVVGAVGAQLAHDMALAAG